jgi:hypothetical protein
MSWATEEFKGIDLGDKRLNKRAFLLAEQLAAKPTARRLSENKVLELVSLQWDAKIINFFAPIFIVNLNSLILTSLLPHNDLIR